MVQHAPIRPKGPVLAHCYSCANHELRVYWYHLQTWYNAPRNFTDRCITMNKRDCQQIALEPCQSQCVTLRQQKTVGGKSPIQASSTFSIFL
ncbi:hypothetical protein D918_08748 [Trichuris suis]|nr:hypothetical protein D918_08748 [Trichuris suis]